MISLIPSSIPIAKAVSIYSYLYRRLHYKFHEILFAPVHKAIINFIFFNADFNHSKDFALKAATRAFTLS